MNTTSPKSSLAKLGIHTKQKSLKVMVLGQSGVGKTAMVVRFITRRYIGEYDPNLEKVYTFNTTLDNDYVQFDILDATGQQNVSNAILEYFKTFSLASFLLLLSFQENDCSNLESNIRWADAFILMYSVTDKCSFDECNRLKFLINYNKKRRKLGSNNKDYMSDVPVILVGNKNDQTGDRMVSVEEGQRRFRELSCACFHEISVRESVDQVCGQKEARISNHFIFFLPSRCKMYFEMYSGFGVYPVKIPNSNVPQVMFKTRPLVLIPVVHFMRPLRWPMKQDVPFWLSAVPAWRKMTIPNRMMT